MVDYRSRVTVAYSDVVLGPDGALWLVDFGNNRIVRWEPGAATETAWTMVDPLFGLLNTTQIDFDEPGRLWMSQFDGLSMDRFDPATGELRVFSGFLRPIHFDFFNGRVYVAEAPNANGSVTVLDPAIALSSVPDPDGGHERCRRSVNRSRAEVRDSTITPTTFSTTADAIPEADLKVTSTLPGILRTEFPSRNAYGIDVTGGTVWVGSEGRLARLLLQTVGTPSDLAVPVASQFTGSLDSQIRVDITLHNRGAQPITGEALYLFSPASFAPREAFVLAPGETRVIRDAFRVGPSLSLLFGPVRFRVTSGAAADLVTSVRTVRTRPDGAAFGYEIPGRSGAESLTEGATRTLFTGSRSTDISIFGFFTPTGAQATATLVAPDGTVRGSRTVDVVANVAQEFNPASSAFGVSPQPGDVIRVTVASGTLQPYVHVFQPSSTDVAVSLPAAASLESFFPNAGSFPGEDRSFFSDLLLSNPGSTPASLTLRFFPLGSSVPVTRTPLSPREARSSMRTYCRPVRRRLGAGRGLRLLRRARDGRAPSHLAPARWRLFRVRAGPRLRGKRPDQRVLPFLRAPADRIAAQPSPPVQRGCGGSRNGLGFNGAGNEIGRLDVALGSGGSGRVNASSTPWGSARCRVARSRRPTPGMVLRRDGELDNVTSDPEYAPAKVASSPSALSSQLL